MSTVPEKESSAAGDAENHHDSGAGFAHCSTAAVLSVAFDGNQAREEHLSMLLNDNSIFVDESGESNVLFGLGDDENGRRRSDRIRAKGKNVDYSQLFSAERFGLAGDRPVGENAGNADDSAEATEINEYEEAMFDNPQQRVFDELNLSDGEEEYKPELDDEAPTSEDEDEEQVENESDNNTYKNNNNNSKRNSLICTEFSAELIGPVSSAAASCNTAPATRGIRGGRGRCRGGGRSGATKDSEVEKRTKRTATSYQPRRRGQPSASLIKYEQPEDGGGFVPCYGMWNPQAAGGQAGSSVALINPDSYYALPTLGPQQQQQQQQQYASAGVAEFSQFHHQIPQFVSAGQMYPQYYALPTSSPRSNNNMPNQTVAATGQYDPYGFCNSSVMPPTTTGMGATATKREADDGLGEHDTNGCGIDDGDDEGESSQHGGCTNGTRKRRKRGGGTGGGGVGADRSEHNRKERIRRAFITKRVLDCWQYVVAAAEQHGGGRDFTRYAPKLDKIRLVSFITAFLDAMKEQMDEFYGPQAWLGMQKVANTRALSLGDIDGNIGLLRELEAFDSETAKRMLKTMQLRAQLSQSDTVDDAASNKTK